MMIINLESKLSGQEPIDRDELFELVSSLGRLKDLITEDDINIKKCNPKECYPLENLDVSQIDNLSFIFTYSMYNGDLSGWNLNYVNKTSSMFWCSKFNNNSISNWDISNIMELDFMFASCPFNKDIFKWEFNKDSDCDYIFGYSENFINKYNNENGISWKSKDFKIWFKENREKMRELNQGTKEEVFDFFDFNNKIIEL